MASPHYLYSISQWLRRKYLGSELKRFQGAMAMDYLEFGNPKGETVLYLHGFADEKHNFYQAGKKLAKKYRIIVPDVPGFGESIKEQHLEYSMDNYVVWLEEFLRFLGHRPFHLMGNSLGGAIALHLALAYASYFRSLTLIDTGAVLPLSKSSIYDEFMAGKNIFVFSSPADIDSFLARVFHKAPFIPGPIKKIVAHEMYGMRHWHEKLTRDFLKGVHPDMSDDEKRALGANDRLKEIALPTLIVWGEHDSLFPVEIADFIHREIPFSKLVVMKKTGHCPQVERPSEFYRHVHEFLSHVS